MVLMFIRNVVLARLLSLEDVAIATYFGMIVGTLEMITEAGLGKYLVQSPDGDSPDAIGAAQLISSVRGGLIGLIIAVSAWPLSWLLSCPQAAWGFCLLGFFPILRGFSHFQSVVAQRTLSFGPSNWVDVSGQLASLLALLMASLWIRDWRLGLIAVLAQAATNLLVSHLVAKQPYRWDRQTERLKAIRAFGLPLVANGALVVLTIYGDRFVLASAPMLSPKSGITLEDIGAFNVVFGLAFTLSMGLFRIINNLFLPILAKSQSNQVLLNIQIRKAGLVVALLAVLIMVVALFVGPMGVQWIYGQRYNLGLVLIGLIAIGQALKLLRANANLISLAMGDSKSILWSNLIRSLGIGLATMSCIFGGGMVMIVASGIVAEALSLMIAIVLLRAKQGIAMRSLLEPIALFAFAVTIAVILRSALDVYY